MKLANLENEVCSLEYSQALKKLGVCQDSPFNWVNAAWTYEINSSLEKKMTEARIKLCFGDIRMIKDVYASWPAPTVGQLFEYLPAFIDTKKDEPFNNFYLHLVKRSAKNIQYILNYYCDTHDIKQEGDPFFANSLVQERIYDEKLADCLAKAVIILHEKEYLK